MTDEQNLEWTNQYSKADVILICCVPVEDLPDLPKREPTLSYEIVRCECGREVWLGSRQKALMQTQHVLMLCVYCAVKRYGTGVLSNLKTMDELNR